MKASKILNILDFIKKNNIDESFINIIERDGKIGVKFEPATYVFQFIESRFPWDFSIIDNSAYCSTTICIHDGLELHNNIETLEGLPDVGNRLTLRIQGNCDRLKDLKGCPKVLKGLSIFNCNLSSLEGGPEFLYNGITLDDMPNLTTLNHFPQKANFFICHEIPIKDFKEIETKEIPVIDLIKMNNLNLEQFPKCQTLHVQYCDIKTWENIDGLKNCYRIEYGSCHFPFNRFKEKWEKSKNT